MLRIVHGTRKRGMSEGKKLMILGKEWKAGEEECIRG